MQPIYIEGFEDVSQEFDLNRDEIEDLIDYTVKRVTAEYAKEWSNQAKQELNSTREQYVNQIVVVDEGKLAGAVVLTGELPMMLEDGSSQFDMKKGFAQSDKRKEKEDGGWYLTIPLRQATSGALGESEVFSAKMPEDITNIMQSKEIRRGGTTSEPLKENEVPDKYKPPIKKQVKMPESNAFREYQHKTTIYAGLRKEQDQDTGQNRYTNFRRVSDKSDPASWIHPGFEALNLAERALETLDIENTVDYAVDNILNQLGYE